MCFPVASESKPRESRPDEFPGGFRVRDLISSCSVDSLVIRSIALSLLHDTHSSRWIEAHNSAFKRLSITNLLNPSIHSRWVNHPLLLSLRVRHSVERVNTEVSTLTIPSVDANDMMTAKSAYHANGRGS